MPTPEPETPTPALPDPPPPPATPAGPACGACSCPAVVNWNRRPTDTELAEHIAREQAWRDERLLLADPQQPAPVFPPLPTAEDTTISVYACTAHAIDGTLAARIHTKSCTAPNETGRWGCDCTPEPPATEPETIVDSTTVELPDHWVPGGA